MPYTAAMHALWFVRGINPGAFHDSISTTAHGKMFIKASGTYGILNVLKSFTSKAAMLERSREGLTEFIELRKKYLLY